MSKKTVVKRLFSILLMVLIVLGTMPVQGGAVFAEGDSQPTVRWDNKTVSWDPVDGVDGYRVKHGKPGGPEYTTDTEETSMDLSATINDASIGRYVVDVYSVKAGVETYMGRTDQWFYNVEVSTAYKEYGDSSYQTGTNGGTVSVTASSGETFTWSDEDQRYYARLGNGDKVTINANQAEGYTFQYFTKSNTQETTESKYEFVVDYANYYITAWFLEDEPDPVKLTLKWSSPDGLNKVEDKVIELVPGTSFWDLGYEKRTAAIAHFNLDGYSSLSMYPGSAYLTPDPITEYNSLEEVENDDQKYEDIEEDTVLYVLMGIELDSGAFSVEQPKCGTVVEWSQGIQTNTPELTPKDGSQLELFSYPGMSSVLLVDDEGIFDGTIEGEKSYAVRASLMPAFGYVMTESTSPEISVENADNGSVVFQYGTLMFTVTAEHDWEDTGEVTTPPTVEDEGVMTYKCKNYDTCGGTKTAPIDKLQETITVTIHASTREGELDSDYAPIVCDSVPKGSTYNAAMAYIEETEGSNHIDLNNTGIYSLYAAWNTKQSFSSYASADDALSGRFGGSDVLEEDTDVYIPYRMVAPVEITIEAPKCGTVVNNGQPGAVVAASAEAKWYNGIEQSPWIKGASNPGNYSGEIVAGNTYYSYIILPLAWGYMSNNSSSATVNGGTFVTNWMTGSRYGFFVSVEAEHDWVFKDITWSAVDGGGYTAKANYTCGEGDAKHTESVDCVVTEEELDGKGIEYTATVSADDSLDGEEHSDTKTVYNVYNLYVQGIHVNGENQDDILGDGKVKYDPKTNTLTLNNATIEASRREYGDDGMEYGIRAYLLNADADLPGATAVEGPLTIELIGENTINNATTSEGTTKVFGIANVSQTKLTFTGGGSLNVNMNASEIDSYTGIEVRNSLEFDGAVVNVNMEGSKPTRGIDVIYSNPVKLSNGAEVHIKTGRHADTYAYYNNRNNKDLTVGEDCIFEAISENLAFHQIDLTDETKSLGALVNTEETMYGAELWDGETDLNTYKYVRIPTIRLTIHWSSIDGEDRMEPVKIGVTPGTRIQESVKILDPNNVYGAYYPFEKEGYNAGFIIFVDQPLSAFTDSTPSSIDDDVSEHSYGGNEEIYDDMDVYFIMFKAVGVEPTVALKAPVCGTEVVTETGVVDTQTNRPEFTIKEDEHYAISEDDEYTCGHYWSADEDDSDYFSGTMEGGEAYYAVIYLEPDIGYYFDKDVTEVTGADEIINSWNNDSWIRVMVSVKAVHDMEEHEGTEATCTEDGNKPYNVCKGCDKWFVDSEGETEITNHDEVIIPALGHDWGAWKETKAPTTDAEGEETRTCSRCDEKETRSVPKLDPQKPTYRVTEGDGGLWTQGSNECLTFTFKRSENDKETFTHFMGINVDGRNVPEHDSSGRANWTAKAGSVIVDLQPSYLETLAVGEHTLTAVFGDGNNPTVTFTIQEKEDTPIDDEETPSDSDDSEQSDKKEDKQDDKKEDQKSDKKAAAKTGDENNPVLWIVLMAIAVAVLGAFVLKNKNKDSSK